MSGAPLIMKPIIIDDAVPNLLFDRFQHEMMSFNVEWHYMQSTSYKGETNNNDESFTHTALFDGQKTSDLLYLYESVLLAGLSKAEVDVRSLIRLRCGMFMKTEKNIIHPPHVDYDFQHTTAILYINESDGDTILYKEKYDNSVNLDARDYYQMKLDYKVTEDVRISPKPNRMVIFDGLTYHSSSSPVNVNRRIVMNCNFL